MGPADRNVRRSLTLRDHDRVDGSQTSRPENWARPSSRADGRGPRCVCQLIGRHKGKPDPSDTECRQWGAPCCPSNQAVAEADSSHVQAVCYRQARYPSEIPCRSVHERRLHRHWFSSRARFRTSSRNHDDCPHRDPSQGLQRSDRVRRRLRLRPWPGRRQYSRHDWPGEGLPTLTLNARVRAKPRGRTRSFGGGGTCPAAGIGPLPYWPESTGVGARTRVETDVLWLSSYPGEVGVRCMLRTKG